MCGIAGFLDLRRERGDAELQGIVTDMADALRHRGPDDDGAWVDAETGVALGFRRLAIIDLSPHGAQPMVSADGRYVLVFNGELYNFRDLRQQLERAPGVRFRGHSDTEVLVEAIAHWGLQESLPRLNGMYAFAVWDRRERRLHLVRDRLGEKPLYYGWAGQTFLFGSELQALRAYPGFDGEIDRGALALYLRLSCVPAPYSIYRGIAKPPPGTMLTLDSERAGALPAPVAYWSARTVAEQGAREPLRGSAADAVPALDTLLRDAVRLRMEADVPLGAFLSGGIDSSTVVALMQAQSALPIKTFTIGFHEAAYDEAAHARAVAEHLGTDHTELYVAPDDALATIPRLPTLYDEPFSDPSQIPTFLVAELARRQVTVALSGDGGDELFAGYNRYFWGRSIWQKFGWLPPALRSAGVAALTWLSPQAWEVVFERMGPLLPASVRPRNPGDKLHKLAEILAADQAEAMYLGLVSHWKDPVALVYGAAEPRTMLTDRGAWPRLPDFTQRMMYLDTVTYLPDDILTKVDRASMAVSLEARVPLLDHRVVEFAWRVPLNWKIRRGQGKWLLRQVLHRYVPAELVDRPKMGFGVPIATWLRGPLRDWAAALLDERRLRHEGLLNPAPIQTKWLEHQSGQRNWQYYLWDVLMFQAWLEERTRVHA
jgi:asparagine synthase (glutamine-hydrolysing)